MSLLFDGSLEVVFWASQKEKPETQAHLGLLAYSQKFLATEHNGRSRCTRMRVQQAASSCRHGLGRNQNSLRGLGTFRRARVKPSPATIPLRAMLRKRAASVPSR